jgi:hypothetical protein
MSIEKHDGLELSPQPKNPERQLEQTRRKHLEALAVALGANPLTAKLSVEALLGSSELAGIDYTEERDKLDLQVVKQIEAIGKWYLSGSDRADSLKFTVGSRVLSLLKENPDSINFTDLKNAVGLWTDGNGGITFDEVLNRKEK